ncbi:hypothetical protein NGM36_19535 [Streptomyces mutabilis]|uniref:hypothetical protein n=1 Tax=Streptomyces mutabilis TaxID=67332 RepID=UPI0022BA3149|nr:hypothetical protein [Streptomyces mutabilis]MCZ9351937.1 hypothetical protein [Streptomyces mutabilis]
MSESTTQPATELASQYSLQVTDDLERNIKEQERIGAEITALQQQLAALQHDHALLVNMQQALGITSAPSQPATAPEPAAATDSAGVPAPRDGAATEPAAGKRTRGRKAAAAPKRAAAPKPGAKPAAKSATRSKPAAKAAPERAAKATTKAAGKPAAKKPSSRTASAEQAAAQPTLVELVRTHLTEQSEPRSAAEVATALGRANSERTIKTTVVRTTLEGLVARNQAQRTKQGTSVYYTATDAPEAAKQPDTDTKTTAAQDQD